MCVRKGCGYNIINMYECWQTHDYGWLGFVGVEGGREILVVDD